MDKIETISEIQLAVKAELEKNSYFAVHGVPILIENAKDIEYQIKNAMSSLGITATVSTPSLTYRGNYTDENGQYPYWELPSFNVVVVENPTLNRGRANYATALDTSLQIAETLNTIPNVCNNTIRQTTTGGLVVVTVEVKSNIAFRYEKVNE